MCLSTAQRSSRSGAIPSRPTLPEPGERLVKARVLKANKPGSSSSPSTESSTGSVMVATSLKKAKANREAGRTVLPITT